MQCSSQSGLAHYYSPKSVHTSETCTKYVSLMKDLMQANYCPKGVLYLGISCAN